MRILCAILALATISSLVAAEKNATAPKNKSDVEQIVHDYLLNHPEVVIEAVKKYQDNQKAEEAKKAQEGLVSHQSQLLSDPTSPAGGADVSAGAVTVVEFFDYRCGYCKKMAPSIAKYVNGSKIRLVYKEFPILGPDSTVAAKAALAARKQGDYLKFHQDLMGLQGTITMAAIEKLASAHNLDVAKLKVDMEDPDIKSQLSINEKLAAAIGVSATPSFVIGNELITGAMDDQEFQSKIAKAHKP
jgi:protein-disulfide isomerase